MRNFSKVPKEGGIRSRHGSFSDENQSVETLSSDWFISNILFEINNQCKHLLENHDAYVT